MTDNPANSWATGQVALTDDDGGTVMFSTNAPKNDALLNGGQTLTRCINVTYNGTWIGSRAAVKLYGTATGALAPYLNLTVTPGASATGGTAADCTGFVADAGGAVFTGTLSGFNTNHATYANGVGLWNPSAAPQTRSYRFVIQVQDTNAAQNLSANGTFTWEVQTT